MAFTCAVLGCSNSSRKLTTYLKYLGIKTDENLNWHEQINDVAVKLNRANAMLSKVRHFVHKKTLKSIDHAIFWIALIVFLSCLGTEY